MSEFPRPTPEEQAEPGFRMQAWGLEHGLCPYHGGGHDIVGGKCRLCYHPKRDLVRWAMGGEIHIERED